MKKIIIGLVLFLVVPFMCQAGFEMSQWRYYKDILGTKGNLVKISIDDEIFSGAKNNLSDIRIIDSTNTEVPYKIVSGKQENKINNISSKLINNSFVPGQSSSVIVDLGAAGSLVNNATIVTSSENFQRNVKIYGGNDMTAWNTLKADAYIYDFTDRKANVKSQNTTVTFPEMAFRYLKIEIADENNNPVKINGINVSQVVSQKINEVSRNLQFSATENTERKSTELISDMGRSGIPLNKIAFSVNGDNFNRAIYVYASKDKNDWKYLGQDYIFRYRTPKFSGENLIINFPETNAQYLKIEISNKDNQPVVVSGLTAHSLYREIVFQANSANSYRVYFGNDKVSYPEYDLDKYFQYLDLESAQLASLSAQKDNPSFVAEKEPLKPLSERIPYLFPGILILTSLLLVFLVYRFLKK